MTSDSSLILRGGSKGKSWLSTLCHHEPSPIPNPATTISAAPDADGLAKRLSEGLSARELVRKNLRGGDGGKRRFFAERFGQAHRNGRLARAGLACQQHGAAGDVALLDQSVHYTHGLDGPRRDCTV